MLVGGLLVPARGDSRCLARSEGSMISIRDGLYYFFPKKNSAFYYLFRRPGAIFLTKNVLFIFYDAEFWRKEGSVNVKVDVARDGRWE